MVCRMKLYVIRKRLAILDAWIERAMYQPGRYDESKAPLAPRSGAQFGGWNPTKRQIAENDLPRYVMPDGRVVTICKNADGEWV